MSRHYLDHASTSPPRPEVVAALAGWWRRAGAGELGDPGRIHAEGLAARHEIEAARETVAAFLGARSREVVFTSGATEAVATAVWGAAERGAHLVVPAVEHSAVRQAADALVEAGTHRQTVVGVDATGRLRVDDVLAAVEDDTALVCVQGGNHEVGAVQPVAEIVAACRERSVLTLVDAASAAGHVPVDFRALGADLLAVSAHKLGGPTGIGALLVRRGLRLRPLLRGGDQERARRAGLEHGAGIVGFAAACAALAAPDTGDATRNRAVADDTSANGEGGVPRNRLVAEADAARRLTDRVRALADGLDGVTVFGPAELEHRLPHLVCLGLAGVEPQPVLLGLDRAGVAVHSGSSCSSEALEPSPVLQAMGVDADRSLRVSVGWSTTDADIDALARELPAVLTHLRALAAR